jgi:hypothetical protein
VRRTRASSDRQRRAAGALIRDQFASAPTSFTTVPPIVLFFGLGAEITFP